MMLLLTFNLRRGILPIEVVFMYDISIFAERLIAERKKKKLTQSDLAEKAKISAQTVSYYEKGTKRPTLENAITIADALGVSIEYLCGNEAKPVSTPISTVADLAQRILEVSKYGGDIIMDEFEEEMQKPGDDYPEWEVESYKAFSIQFYAKWQPELVKFFANRERMRELLNDHVFSEAIYNSWVNGEMQELKKIRADSLPF
jgi:transcriptional regulator with XRE-family HTH domain